MGKFDSAVLATAEESKKAKAQRKVKSAKLAQEKLIAGLEQQIIEREDTLEGMFDQTDAGSSSWVSTYQAVTLELAGLKVELDVAKENKKDLFGDE